MEKEKVRAQMAESEATVKKLSSELLAQEKELNKKAEFHAEDVRYHLVFGSDSALKEVL